VRGHFFVSPIDARLIPARLGHTGLQIVRHHDLGHAAHKLEGAHMRTDPVGQSLGQARFGIGIIAGAQHGVGGAAMIAALSHYGRTVRFAREERIGERFAEGWQVMYDEDGRYFRTSGPATSQVLIADGP